MLIDLQYESDINKKLVNARRICHWWIVVYLVNLLKVRYAKKTKQSGVDR